MSISLIGYGKLGAAVAARLRDQGHSVIVYNRTAEKPVQDGYEVVNAVHELSDRSSSAILICLSDSDAVSAVLDGEHGLLSRSLEDTLCIDLTTHDYAAVSSFHDKVKAAGGRYLEAPVVGSVIPAREGKLVLWASGEERDYKTAGPLLEQIAATRSFVGAPGRATRMKLINNGVLAGFLSVLSEAIDLAERNGFSREEAVDLLGQGAGKSTVLAAKQAKVLGGDYSPHFALETLLKDLDLVKRLAGENDRPVSVLSDVTAQYRKAADVFPGEDFAAVFKLIRN